MPFRTIDEAFSYIESFTNFEKTTPASVREYKLARMRFLLEQFGNPHQTYKTVHIAGSKGKGSTAAFLSSILTEAGFITGLYTSPHVISYKERITVCGRQPDDPLLVRLIEMMRRLIERGIVADRFGEEAPTTFELLTLLAFLTFKEMNCSWVVVETGIGGRLDATNVVSPEASIITPVELEHTDILGDTLEQIATEKAGIIKENIPVFSGYQQEPVTQVFIRTAKERNAPLIFLKDELISLTSESSVDEDTFGTIVNYSWRDGSTHRTTIRLLGDVQAENSALALLTARGLFSNTLLLSRSQPTRTPQTGTGQPSANQSRPAIEKFLQGLEKTVVFGRMEIASRRPPVLLDGAHTPSSIARLIAFTNKLFPGEKILLYGSVIGKDYITMASQLAPHFSKIIISTPGTFKKSNPRELFTCFSALHGSCTLLRSPEEALSKALELSQERIPVIVTGSFYMVSEIKKLMRR